MASNPIIANIDITKFRRFKDFRGLTPDFDRYNIFYGWNYSGKTTLSRIFAFYNGLSDDKNIDKDAEFFLKTSFGDLDISQTDKIKIHTFNSDYIKNNLFFEKQFASNIIVVSDKAVDVIEKIKGLKNSRTKLIQDLQEFNKQYDTYEKEYNKKRSEYAIEIDKFLTEKFTAKNISAIENKLDKSDLNNYILEDSDKKAKIKTLRNPTKFSHIKNIDKIKTVNIQTLISMLQKSVSPSAIIKKLQEKKAEEWVKLGIELHENTDTCLFCGAKLSHQYLEYLDKVFKSEYDNLGNSLLDFNNNLNIYSAQIPAPGSIVDNYQNDYQQIHKVFTDEIIKYNNKINAIIKIINSKYKNRNLEFKTKITLNTDKINELIGDLNILINKHNLFIANEYEAKNKIKEDLKNCIIAELLSDPSYQKAIQYKNEASSGKTALEKDIKTLSEQISLEEAKISDVKRGAEEINKILKRLFVNNANVYLKVEQGYNDKEELVDITKLYRNDNTPAENLSDGERTAIAFAHFYTKIIDSINNKVAKDEIIFIDDPISSLDKNHIYSISVMIKEVIDKFNQTFVTTHSYELYRLLKRKKQVHTNFYYIKREKDTSVITELPDELKKYDSEYEYFFHQLYKFNQDNTDADIYLIGHCARRFLDNYLEYKIPNNQNPLDKLTKYIKNINEDVMRFSILYRIVNDESHVHPEILFDKSYLISAISLLLETIKNHDKLHYDTLVESCGIQL